MPCRVGGPLTADEIARGEVHSWKAKADKLTAENDLLRETILHLVQDPHYKISPKAMKIINTEQMKHRKEDLDRLERVFRKLRDAERLGKVMLADPTKPLAEQLGFDPDDF